MRCSRGLTTAAGKLWKKTAEHERRAIYCPPASPGGWTMVTVVWRPVPSSSTSAVSLPMWTRRLTAQERIAFSNDEHIVTAGEEGDALAGGAARGIAEKFRGNLKRRRGWRRLGADKRLRSFCGLLARREGRRSGSSDKDVAVRAGALRLAQFFQTVQVQAGLLNVQRLKRGIFRPARPNRWRYCCARCCTGRRGTRRQGRSAR